MVCNLKRIDQTLFYCIMCRQVNKKYYEDIDGHLNYSLPDSPLVWIYARDKNVPLFPAPPPPPGRRLVLYLEAVPLQAHIVFIYLANRTTCNSRFWKFCL